MKVEKRKQIVPIYSSAERSIGCDDSNCPCIHKSGWTKPLKTDEQ